MGDTGMALAVAFTAALAVLFFVLLWRRRREAGASACGGFVLFDVCFQDDTQRRAVREYSMGRSRRRAPRERSPGEAADDEQEPDEGELARWKKMSSGVARSLSTIEEGTEKGTTPITTPVFCTPPASPDRSGDARALDMASIAVQVKT